MYPDTQHGHYHHSYSLHGSASRCPPPADLQSGPDTPRWLPKCMLVQEAMEIVRKNTENCAQKQQQLSHFEEIVACPCVGARCLSKVRGQQQNMAPNWIDLWGDVGPQVEVHWGGGWGLGCL